MGSSSVEKEVVRVDVYLRRIVRALHESVRWQRNAIENRENGEMQKKVLDYKRKELEDQIEVWLSPGFGEKVREYAEDLPDLSGVPLSHDWWSSEQRELSKQIYHTPSS